jgi:hypothetical protein
MSHFPRCVHLARRDLQTRDVGSQSRGSTLSSHLHWTRDRFDFLPCVSNLGKSSVKPSTDPWKLFGTTVPVAAPLGHQILLSCLEQSVLHRIHASFTCRLSRPHCTLRCTHQHRKMVQRRIRHIYTKLCDGSSYIGVFPQKAMIDFDRVHLPTTLVFVHFNAIRSTESA